MSSYNSQRYIVEQVRSILNQEGVEVRLWIRDDGSTDNTVRLLREKFGSEARLAISEGSNVGACKSFLEAMRACPFDGDYFGFSDADDVWASDKIEHSISVIKPHGESEPIAVATRLEVVDERLKHICYSRIPHAGMTFQNALTETVATGMTILMNKTARDLVVQYQPRSAAMHDSWVYLLVTATGKFIYSPRPTVKYRQHEHNLFGTAHSFVRRNALRWDRLTRESVFRPQALEFMEVYGARLEKPKFDALERYCRYPDALSHRVAFMLRPSIVRQRWTSNVLMRLLVLLGRA